jgi:outer membrane protein assembly factor BamD (BamD/ComL family)
MAFAAQLARFSARGPLQGEAPWVLYLKHLSLAGWFYFYMEYIRLSKRDAAMWLDAKPIVEPEGH